jgi:drug/metabolite transporter (DMT)-like permease
MLPVVAALLAVYVVWGSTYLAIRIGLDGFPPFLMAAIRMLFAGTVMYIALRWRGMPAPTRAQWWVLAKLSVFMMLLGNALVNVAELHVSTGLAAIAIASMPLWAALFAALRGQHPSRMELLGLALGFAGVLWLNIGSPVHGAPIGMLCLLTAPIAWAWGSIWSRTQDLPTPFMSAAGQMLCGCVLMAITGVLLGERITAMPSLNAILAVGYLAVFGSIVAFTAYIWLLHNVRPALATSYAYVNPPIAVLMGALALGEDFGIHEIGAMAIILLGVGIITLAKTPARAPAEIADAA